MITEIVRAIYKYMAKNNKKPDLILVSKDISNIIDKERYTKGFIFRDIYQVDGSVYVDSIVGVKLIKSNKITGVYFCEEQVL